MSVAPLLGLTLILFGQPAAPAAAPSATPTPAAKSTPMVLTIDDVARLASKQNRSIQQAQQAIAAAKAALSHAVASGSYSLSASAGVTALGPIPSVTIPISPTQNETFKLVPDLEWNATLTLLQPVTHGGALYWQQEVAKQGVDAAVYKRDATELQVTSLARQLFLQVIQAQQLENVAAENVSRAAAHLQDARARVRAGTAPGYDAIRAEADVENANNGLVAAHAAVEQTLAVLKTLLVINVQTPVQLKAPTPGAPMKIDVTEAIKASVAHRPEVRAVDVAYKIAQMRVHLADAAKGTNVDAVATYTRQASSGFGGIGEQWTVGLQASRSIFDHGATRAAVKEAEANARSAEEAARATREQIAQQVYQACVSLRQATEQIVDAEKGAKAAEEAMRIADLSYREGVATPVQVTDARAALIAAHANLVNARFGYELAVVALQAATGVSIQALVTGSATSPTEPEPSASTGAQKPAPSPAAKPAETAKPEASVKPAAAAQPAKAAPAAGGSETSALSGRYMTASVPGR